eukprot:TRINITY_DN2593_c0_g1_i8.p1 TRINITY_DN2593_c0_g1~~TRINITY_DN2593_c0_g1_i8.p1  ORF type:complete len:176 (-),score=41.53 TRINITY_DN2593_c0_g1_i8:32-559(-)
MCIRDRPKLRERLLLPWLSLLLTMWSSCVLANFFSFVKSSNGNDISTVLYFTRLFCDLLSRPVARLGRPFFVSTPARLLGSACLRTSLLLVFMLYIGEVLPQSNVFIIGFVACYAFMSGYLSVFSYQISQELAGPSPELRDRSAKHMNGAFQMGTFLSAVLSITAVYVIEAVHNS